MNINIGLRVKTLHMLSTVIFWSDIRPATYFEFLIAKVYEAAAHRAWILGLFLRNEHRFRFSSSGDLVSYFHARGDVGRVFPDPSNGTPCICAESQGTHRRSQA